MCVLKVNAISVRAIFRRTDGDVFHFDALRAIKLQVALRAIDDLDTTNCHIVALVESHSLKERKLLILYPFFSYLKKSVCPPFETEKKIARTNLREKDFIQLVSS